MSIFRKFYYSKKGLTHPKQKLENNFVDLYVSLKYEETSFVHLGKLGAFWACQQNM